MTAVAFLPIYLEKLDATQKGNGLMTYRGKPDLTTHADKAQRITPVE